MSVDAYIRGQENLPVITAILALWGCMPEITSDCRDMSNASSTYIGILAGAVIGGLISWWIYNRQQKTSEKQDRVISRIKELEERHDRILKKIEKIEEKHDATLDALSGIDRKIEHGK